VGTVTSTLPRVEITPPARPAPVLFLIADTGGGHRAAAEAVIEALDRLHPGRFEPVLCDPLAGPRAAWLLRRCSRLYGPLIRWAPWLWGAVYYACDSRWVMRLLRSTLLALANRPVADAVARERPAVIASFHPLTGAAAVHAGKRGNDVPVVTVVTDLVKQHAAWWDDRVDRLVLPQTAAPWRQGVALGQPVASAFGCGPLQPHQRVAVRRSLGVSPHRFLVVLTGGGEGSGGLSRRAVALLRHLDVDVAVLCGRNRRLQHRLGRLSPRFGGRLAVRGFVDNMADWLRCADVVVGKAGPGTVAEALCCGVPLVLTSHVPGQEKGNAEFVVGAGAGRHAPRVRGLVREIDVLRRDPSAVQAMRTASIRLARPHAAARVAMVLAELAGSKARRRVG
jgi:1,2-diacylglycerol 3-beta-galactosyltransferase